MATSEVVPVPLLSSAEAAARLKITSAHLVKLCKEGKISYTTSGEQRPRYWFTERDLATYLSRRYHSLKRFEAKWGGK